MRDVFQKKQIFGIIISRIFGYPLPRRVAYDVVNAGTACPPWVTAAYSEAPEEGTARAETA